MTLWPISVDRKLPFWVTERETVGGPAEAVLLARGLTFGLNTQIGR